MTFTHSESWHDPTMPQPGTHWTHPAEDYPAPLAGAVSGWASADPPGGLPAELGWLLAHRGEESSS